MTLTAPSAVPTHDELVQRTAEVVPTLAANALWTEQNRRIHDDSLAAVTNAGVVRMNVPRRYGGYQADFPTSVAALAEVARGCGSTSWVSSVWNGGQWLVAMLPDEAQDEIFSDPDARISGILSPSARAVAVDGGYLVNGKWAYNTGCLHATWDANAVLLEQPGQPPQPGMVAIPLSDLVVVDDWYVAGLKGTGSNSTVAKDVFVPAHRAMPMGPAVAEQRYLSQANANEALYRVPVVAALQVLSAGTALGLARASLDFFLERVGSRGITYTNYERQADAALTHLQVAEAVEKLTGAEYFAFRAAENLQAMGQAGGPWTVEQRCRVRVDVAYGVKLAKEAVDILANASGSSSIRDDVPIQRFERDVHTVSLHAQLHPNTNLELYGRVICGLEPNTPYF